MGPAELADLFVLLLSLQGKARNEESDMCRDLIGKLRAHVLSEGTPGIFAVSVSCTERSIFAVAALRRFTELGLGEIKEVLGGCRLLLTTREAADALVKHMRLSVGDAAKVEIEERQELGDLAGNYHCP